MWKEVIQCECILGKDFLYLVWPNGNKPIAKSQDEDETVVYSRWSADDFILTFITSSGSIGSDAETLHTVFRRYTPDTNVQLLISICNVYLSRGSIAIFSPSPPGLAD